MKHIYFLFLLLTTFSYGLHMPPADTPKGDSHLLSSTEININNDQDPIIKVFPNPVSGDIIYFEYGKSLQVSIYNVLGKQVLKSNINNTKNQINISTLKKGIYILRMTSDTGTTTKKLIRQ